jgi:hypothetical protein
MCLRKILSNILLVVVMQAMAQEHPFLGRFELREGEGQVFLDWTMNAGSTCDGTVILRSTDSLHFEPVGIISELCGDILRPVDYRFVDEDPGELRTLYYRLDLGINGSSSVRRIDLKRLTSAEHRFQPSPVRDHGSLLLKLSPEKQVEVIFFDPSGREVYRFQGTGGNHSVVVRGWSSGLHVYQVWVDGAVWARGKMVVE